MSGGRPVADYGTRSVTVRSGCLVDLRWQSGQRLSATIDGYRSQVQIPVAVGTQEVRVVSIGDEGVAEQALAERGEPHAVTHALLYRSSRGRDHEVVELGFLSLVVTYDLVKMLTPDRITRQARIGITVGEQSVANSPRRVVAVKDRAHAFKVSHRRALTGGGLHGGKCTRCVKDLTRSQTDRQSGSRREGDDRA